MVVSDGATDVFDPSQQTDLPVTDGDWVVLALRSSDCLAFFRSREESSSSRNLLVYDLEEEVPYDGDDLSVDQIATQSGSLIVATNGSDHEATVDRLDLQGAYVSAVTPTVLLALATLGRQLSLRSVDFVLWHSAEGIDLIRLVWGKPVDWRWATSDVDSIAETLRAMQGEEAGADFLLVDWPVGLAASFPDSFQATEVSLDRDDAAAQECQRIVRGTSNPLVDLRSGPLQSSRPLRPIESSLRLFLVAAFLLQLAIVGAAFLRSNQYRQKADQMVAVQEQAFQKIFPGEPIPVGIVSRLESEHRRLVGTRGLSDQNIPKLVSAVPITHKVLSALPKAPNVRFVIDKMEILPDRLALINGTAKSYQELEVIANRMRIAGLDVPPISATKTGDGVTLRLEEIEIVKKEKK